MAAGQRSFVVEGQDLFAAVADRHTSNNQLSCVLETDATVHLPTLTEAFRHAASRYPVIACTMRLKGDEAAWMPRDYPEAIRWCTLSEHDDRVGHEQAIQRFVAERFSEDDGQAKAGVFRHGTDTVVVKIRHACADGAGLTQFVLALLRFYNEIAEGRTPQLAPPATDRSLRAILSQTELRQAAERRERSQPTPTVAFRGSIGGAGDQTTIGTAAGDGQAFTTARLSGERLTALRAFARLHGATLNDAALAAFCRAVALHADVIDDLVTVNLTIDLRRYLPGSTSGSICNCSGGEIVAVRVGAGETLGMVLGRTATQTRAVKRDFPGVSSAFAMEAMGQLGAQGADEYFRARRQAAAAGRHAIPYFSNLGVISGARLTLGEADVAECYAIGQAMLPPGLVVAISTYGDTMTTAVNSYPSTIAAEDVRGILTHMTDDLASV